MPFQTGFTLRHGAFAGNPKMFAGESGLSQKPKEDFPPRRQDAKERHTRSRFGSTFTQSHLDFARPTADLPSERS
jgi:hypothetical protein